MLNLVQQQHYELAHKQSTFDRLSIKEVDLLDCLRRGESVRRSKTKNDTNAGGGNAFFNDTNRAMRDTFRAAEYEAFKQGNLELTVNKNLKVAIYLRSGCDQTGLVDGQPSSKRPLSQNTQRSLNLYQDSNPYNLNLFDQAPNQGVIPLDYELWVILHYYDPYTKSVRAELVKPVSCNSQGFLTGFDRDSRLILDLTQNEFMGKSPEFNGPIDFEIEI